MATAARGAATATTAELLFSRLGIPARLLCSLGLSGGGSRDPTETPRSPPPFCEIERHESLEKEDLRGMRARGLLQGDGPSNHHSKTPRANRSEVYPTRDWLFYDPF